MAIHNFYRPINAIYKKGLVVYIMLGLLRQIVHKYDLHSIPTQ